MKNQERLVSYVTPQEKAFIEELSNAAQLSQSALIVHAIEQIQARYKYLHSLPLKERLIKIIKSHNLYCTDNGERGIKIGDTNFQQKLSLPKDLTVDGITRWFSIIYDSFTNDYKTGNVNFMPRYIQTLPLIIKDLKLYSAELDFNIK